MFTTVDYYGCLLIAAILASGIGIAVHLWILAYAVQNAGRRIAAAVRGEPDPIKERDEAV